MPPTQTWAALRSAPPSETFAALYRAHAAQLRAYARRLYGEGSSGGDDLSQRCAERMYRKFHLFSAGTNFVAWGRQITLNLYLTEVGKHKRWRGLNRAIPASADWLHDGAAHNHGGANYDYARLRQLIAALSPCLRTAFCLRYEGLSYEEIAAQVGAPVGTVKSRVHFARQKLRVWVEDLYAEPRPLTSQAH